MNIDLSRRSFLKLAGAGAAATSLGAMGFGAAEAATAAHVRAFKLATTTETRNVCTYCSVACGILMYSKGDLSAGETAELIHIEGDADHPTNRGTLCPKGAALKDFVKSETRATKPRPSDRASPGRRPSTRSPGRSRTTATRTSSRRTRPASRSTAGRPWASSPPRAAPTRPDG
jgi:formate dehydrogenase major subunit